MDPLFLSFNEQLLKMKQTKYKQMSAQFILESPPTQNGFGVQEQKQE